MASNREIFSIWTMHYTYAKEDKPELSGFAQRHRDIVDNQRAAWARFL